MENLSDESLDKISGLFKEIKLQALRGANKCHLRASSDPVKADLRPPVQAIMDLILLIQKELK